LQRHRLYQKSYSLEQLTDQLLRVPEEELPGNRFGTWQALQALFCIYDEDDGNDEEGEAGEGEEEKDKGVKKGAAARLIRRLERDEFYFVPGSARKSSGSFYTREEIVQYLVRKALEGLIEDKSAAQIESLRVIDLACGSAHFLVGAARYMGRKLLDAYHRKLKDDPPPEFYPDRPLTPEVHQRWHSEGEAWCKRRIIERCLFGVDLNPTAVQLAQVALWIESLAGDRPAEAVKRTSGAGTAVVRPAERGGVRARNLGRVGHVAVHRQRLGMRLEADVVG